MKKKDENHNEGIDLDAPAKVAIVGQGKVGAGRKAAAAMGAMALAAGVLAEETEKSSGHLAELEKEMKEVQAMYEGPIEGFYSIGKSEMAKDQKKRRKRAIRGRKANKKRMLNRR